LKTRSSSSSPTTLGRPSETLGALFFGGETAFPRETVGVGAGLAATFFFATGDLASA